MSDEYDEQDRDDSRYVPSSGLDLNFTIINTMWGKSFEMNPAFKGLFEKYVELKDNEGNFQVNEKGQVIVTKKNLWELMNFFTRDFRLANLDRKDLVKCRVLVDLAIESLDLNFFDNFFILLSEVAGILETSQSKGGWLRKNLNTMTTERVNRQDNPRKGLFQKKESKEGF